MMERVIAILRADLPNWIPEPQRVKFAADLDALRRVHGLTDDDIAEQVAEVLAVHAENMANPAFILHSERGRSVVAGEPVSELVARRERMIRFLALIVQAAKLGQEKGLVLLTDPEHAKTNRIGVVERKRQSKRAKSPRGKVTDEGETLNTVIGRLALAKEHRDESAKSLWRRFFGILGSELHLNPSEFDHPSNADKSGYEYDFIGGRNPRKRITFGTFKKVVSLYRSGEKELL